MRTLIRLLRGGRGHPLHPPLTDISVGAYTVGTVAVVLGWVGVEEPAMAKVGFLAIVIGLIVSGITILAGFLDYLKISRGTPLWNTATMHFVSMGIANGGFIAAAALLQAGYSKGVISTAAGAVTVGAFVVLAVGAYIGGTIVFWYGMRVVNEETSAREAVKYHFPPEE